MQTEYGVIGDFTNSQLPWEKKPTSVHDYKHEISFWKGGQWGQCNATSVATTERKVCGSESCLCHIVEMPPTNPISSGQLVKLQTLFPEGGVY